MAKAEDRLRSDRREREKAERTERTAEGTLAAAKARLEKQKAAQAHGGFEAAAKASQGVEGFAELRHSLKVKPTEEKVR